MDFAVLRINFISAVILDLAYVIYHIVKYWSIALKYSPNHFLLNNGQSPYKSALHKRCSRRSVDKQMTAPSVDPELIDNQQTTQLIQHLGMQHIICSFFDVGC